VGESGVMEQIAERVRLGRRFLLTCHRKPDGDAIGSEIALALTIESLGKEAVIINRDPCPSAYERLPEIERVRVGCIAPDEPCDALFVIECTERDRCGQNGIDGHFVVNIDHHSKNRLFGDLNWVDTRACAVGEMIYDLTLHMGVALTPDIATHLYVSIATDTGFFHFSNSTARAFEICAELARAGADPARVADALHDHNRPGQILLLGRCLSRLEVDPSGKIASIAMFVKDVEDIEIAEGDTEGIINHPRSIDGVEVAVFYKEVDRGSFRIGLRSRRDVDVAAVAAEFGGGGHPQASGCSIEGDYDTVRERLVAALRRQIESKRAGGEGRTQ